MTTRVETFVDTNVLLAATARNGPAHVAALAMLEAGFADGSLHVSGQVVREYLAVATRPAAVNGLGLPLGHARDNVAQFLERARCLEEDASVLATLLTLIDAVPCLGKQVHDANIVATMLAHGVPRLWTLNRADFVRFEPRIAVVGIG